MLVLSVEPKTCDTEDIGNTDTVFVSLTKLKITTAERWVFFFLVCNLTLWMCFVASLDDVLLGAIF